jgi:ABC-2 type transport system ATP-binding protein
MSSMSLTTLEGRAGEATAATATGGGPAVSVRGLQKSFGAVEAVRGIDLDVAPGELFGFLGPNGAGKSTTIKVLTTLARPTAGTATVAGYDVVTERAEVRRHIGLVFQEPTLDDHLTAEQNLRFHADVYGLARAVAAERVDAVLDLVGLAGERHRRVGTFSGGMKRRLEVGRGLMHAPAVLFLDEPTVGLDPESRAALWDHVEGLRRRQPVTIFLTTHYMDEAERCDRVAIVDEGRVVALDTPAALQARVADDVVTLTTGDPTATQAALRAAGLDATLDVAAAGPGAGAGAGEAARVIVRTPDGPGFVPRLFTMGLDVRAVTVARPTLDDVFLAVTGNRLAGAGR